MPDKAAFSAIVVFFSRRPTQYGVIRPVQAAAASYSKLREELLLCLGSVHISSHGNLLAQNAPAALKMRVYAQNLTHGQHVNRA